MQVLITAIGSSGDILPYLPIGRELIRRGHQVAMLANPYFEKAVRTAGLGFRRLGRTEDLLRDFRRIGRVGSIGSPLRFAEWVIGQVPLTVQEVRSAIHDLRPDVIVRHKTHVGVQWTCREARIQCVVGAVAPAAWLSLHDRAESIPLPRAFSRLGFIMARQVLRGFLEIPWERRLTRLRSRLGFRPGKRLLWDELTGGDCQLGIWSRSFRPPMPDDPKPAVITGFSFQDPPQDARDELESFLDRGDPPIIFTLGASGVHARLAERFHACAVETCRRLGRRGVILTGNQGKTGGHIHDSILVLAYAPHARVFSRASLVVCHAGIGTMAEALRAGLPMVTVPLLFDQPDAAWRARRLGVAEVVPPSRLTPARLVRATRRALEDSTLRRRAAEIRAIMRTENGPVAAADAIERIGETDDRRT